jgi:hypothetical protein
MEKDNLSKNIEEVTEIRYAGRVRDYFISVTAINIVARLLVI